MINKSHLFLRNEQGTSLYFDRTRGRDDSEENKNEISVRTSFTAKNDKTSAGRLSELIKPGCLIGIFGQRSGKGNGAGMESAGAKQFQYPKMRCI